METSEEDSSESEKEAEDREAVVIGRKRTRSIPRVEIE